MAFPWRGDDPAFVRDELAAHIAAYPDPRDAALVFTSDEGASLRRSNFRPRIWVSAAKAATLPTGARFHP
jgi:hypothetical protein